MKTIHGAVAAIAMAMTFGCQPPPVAPPPFQPGMVNRPITAEEPGSGVDRSGLLQLDPEAAPPRPAPAAQEAAPAISPLVRENVKPPRAEVSLASAPATRSTVISPASGQYMTLGGLVAEVNGTPIYADKVLAQVEPVLAARAREQDRIAFRATAIREIRQQVQAMINLEVEYAAAIRNLSEEDRLYAERLTQQWRQHKIAEAQGSLELARKRAAEQGQKFDEMVDEQYRVFMSQVFFQKKIVPRIQVTAEDLRRYYEAHRSADFTEPDRARFRLIKISIAKAGSREAAMQKAQAVRDRIERGEDFENVAASANDDPVLARSGGQVLGGGWVNRGAFAQEKIEQAVWAASGGSLTPVIEASDALYIAKVEEKKAGRVVPFDEEGVQQRIREALRGEQFRSMREQVQQDLIRNAMVRSDEAMLGIAIDMAMENYGSWSTRSRR